MKKDPKKEMLDPRDMLNPNKLTSTCPRCEYLNHIGAINCYNCEERIAKDIGISTRYKVKGSKYNYTRKELDFALDYGNKHRKDLLQPTRYNKLERKFEPNPEFIKEYGDPFKQNTQVGSAVEKELQSGSARVVDGTPNTDKFIKKTPPKPKKKTKKLS